MSGYNWSEPSLLIENSNGKFQINVPTLNKVKKITAPIICVGIIGKYRTGKSHLMNILARKKVFDTSSSSEAHTKGIWCFCKPHPNDKNVCLMLMDTEGLGDVEKGSQENDACLFILCVLLTSTLVYNSTGAIDQDAMDKLQCMTEFARRIKVRTDDIQSENNLKGLFSNFVWCVRDFTLDLKIKGKSCTADEYLENGLKVKPGSANNQPRECIKAYFEIRKCFTFPYLDKDKQFRNACDQFAKYVLSQRKIKKVLGVDMTGTVLAGLCSQYVEAIKNGIPLCIESAFQMTAKIENLNAKDQSIELYCNKMSGIPLPTDSADVLLKAHASHKAAAMKRFQELSLCDDDGTYKKQVESKIEAKYDSLVKQNEEKSEKKCNQLLRERYAEKVSSKIEKGVYAKKGGYDEYNKDVESVKAAYKAEPNKGVKSQEVLKDFWDGKKGEETTIRVGQDELAKKEKEIESRERDAENKGRASANESSSSTTDGIGSLALGAVGAVFKGIAVNQMKSERSKERLATPERNTLSYPENGLPFNLMYPGGVERVTQECFRPPARSFSEEYRSFSNFNSPSQRNFFNPGFGGSSSFNYPSQGSNGPNQDCSMQ